MAGKVELELSDETLEFLRSKVASGEFASAGAVVEEGIAILRQGTEELQTWVRDIGMPAYQRYKADPSSAIPADEIEGRLEARRRMRQKLSA